MLNKNSDNIIIVNYGMGNLNSVQRKLSKLGLRSEISDNPEQIIEAKKIILPGVGHFKKAVENLHTKKLWEPLNQSVLRYKTPILGICLGLQLMGKHSEEGDCNGFGWLEADIVRFQIKDKLKFKIPHIGWNSVRQNKDSRLTKGVENHYEFYFVHSYHMKSHNTSQILNYTTYEYEFISAMEKENIFGIQYHPEKSHEFGEKLFLNFASI